MRGVSANRHGTARCVAKLCRYEISDSKQVSREEDIPVEEEDL